MLKRKISTRHEASNTPVGRAIEMSLIRLLNEHKSQRERRKRIREKEKRKRIRKKKKSIDSSWA